MCELSFYICEMINLIKIKIFKRFLLTKSIEEAAKNNNKTLTVLLTARLIGDNPLIDFDLNSLITIRNSLKSIGFENLSKIITQEIMTSKIINL